MSSEFKDQTAAVPSEDPNPTIHLDELLNIEIKNKSVNECTLKRRETPKDGGDTKLFCAATMSLSPKGKSSPMKMNPNLTTTQRGDQSTAARQLEFTTPGQFIRIDGTDFDNSACHGDHDYTDSLHQSAVISEEAPPALSLSAESRAVAESMVMSSASADDVQATSTPNVIFQNTPVAAAEIGMTDDGYKIVDASPATQSISLPDLSGFKSSLIDDPNVTYVVINKSGGISKTFGLFTNGENADFAEVLGEQSAHVGGVQYMVVENAPQVALQCGICDQVYDGREKLRAHFTTHASNRDTYVCEVCEKEFANVHALTAHKPTHTGEKRYKCGACDKNFSQAGNLQLHLRVHTGEKKFECDVCEKRFSQKGNMQTHRKIHDRIREFKCMICDTAFAQKINLQTHVTQKHAMTELSDVGTATPDGSPGEGTERAGGYQCDICKKYYSTEDSMLTHRQCHDNVSLAEFECDLCKKRYSTKGNLDTHRRLHENQGDFRCPVCERAFTQKGNLKTHIRLKHEDQLVETEEGMHLKDAQIKVRQESYHCEFCSKSFSLKGNMKAHLKIHDKEHYKHDKKFACDVCGKGFTQKGNLHTHVRIKHDESTNVRCKICNVAQWSKQHLENHIKARHPETLTVKCVYPCRNCNKRFINPASLTKHTLDKHERKKVKTEPRDEMKCSC